jgi:hypothetical protein
MLKLEINLAYISRYEGVVDSRCEAYMEELSVSDVQASVHLNEVQVIQATQLLKP